MSIGIGSKVRITMILGKETFIYSGLITNEDEDTFTIKDKFNEIVRLTKKYINLIIVNCEAGVSRSAGIAAALAKYLGQSDERFFNPRGPYCPNRYVYRTLLNVTMDSRPIGE